MKTLHRNLVQDILKHILFFLLLFYLLYAISDYSAHIQEFFKSQSIPVNKVLLYYFHQLIKQLHLLLPLALLITSMKILIALNRNFELVALQSAGLSLQKIAAPFFMAGIICTTLLYISGESLYPRAERQIELFQNHYLSSAKKGGKKIQGRDLVDGTKIIYQAYDAEKKEFSDLYWVKSLDDIWYAKTMKLDQTGQFVDHFLRNERQQLEKIASFSEIPLPALSLKIQEPIDESQLSLKQLFSMHPDEKVRTQIWLKLLQPLLPLIIITAIIPFCTAFARDKRHLFTFALALFSFFAFFSIMNACAILSESGTLPPYLALLPFPLALELFFLVRWIKN